MIQLQLSKLHVIDVEIACFRQSKSGYMQVNSLVLATKVYIKNELYDVTHIRRVLLTQYCLTSGNKIMTLQFSPNWQQNESSIEVVSCKLY